MRWLVLVAGLALCGCPPTAPKSRPDATPDAMWVTPTIPAEFDAGTGGGGY